MNNGKRNSTRKKILIVTGIILLFAAVAFHVFITRYLPPIVKERLSSIIINGSDSLYKVDMGKFDLSFWGGSARFTNLHITIDSNRYKKINEARKLPPVTFELFLPEAEIRGIKLGAFIFSKKINIRQIIFNAAELELARHFKTTDTLETNSDPLWKLIQPDVRSIKINAISCADLKVNYLNVDSATSFRWQFEKCNILINNINVDSAAAKERGRMLYAKNLALTAKDVKIKTPDGLYELQAKDILYISSGQSLKINQFKFFPAVNEQQFINHFGFQHEIYKIEIPAIGLKNFQLSQWTRYNRLEADTIQLNSPSITVQLNRNAKPNPYSKKGKYPHQLLQKAPFTMVIGKLKAMNASVTYYETNNATQLTGKLVFPSLNGTIDNITNDPLIVAESPECVVDVRGSVMKTGKLHAVFRFDLADKNGAFNVSSTITNIDAPQIRSLFKAMTAVEIQSFNIKRIDYTIDGNEDAGSGALNMKYDNMDILLNKVEEDKTFNKQGFLSFFANRFGIYNANPMEGEEERKAVNVIVQRDVNRSFFNLVWKTMFNSAGEIVLRPIAKRKIAKKKNQKER